MTLNFPQEEQIRKIVREEIKSEIKSQTRLLPTKNEFFSAMSELMGEVKSLREEHAVVQGHKDQLEDHESRLEIIETKLNIAV